MSNINIEYYVKSPVKIIQSRSSRFRYINLLEDVILGFEIKIITRELSIPQLPTGREKRLEFIYQLHLEGRPNKFITDYFNSRDVKTPRGKPYTQKNIWVTFKKYRKRLLRNNYNILQIKECLYVIPINKNT